MSLHQVLLPPPRPLQLQLLPPPLPQLHPAQPLPLSTRISPAPKPTPKKSVLTFLESKGRRREKGARAGANKENEAA